MDYNISKIGLEDIEFGVGTYQVTMLDGTIKVRTKVNLGNIPFDEARTVNEVLTEFETLLSTSDYAIIKDALPDIVAVRERLLTISNVSEELAGIAKVADSVDLLRDIAVNLPYIINVSQSVVDVRQAFTDAKHILCRTTYIEQRVLRELQQINDVATNYLHPALTKLEAMEQRLDELMADAVATVVQGQDMAIKFATYDIQVVNRPNCANPRFIVDDNQDRIIFEVPTVKGDCAVVDLTDPNIVKDAVDAYLATLPNLGGSTFPTVTQDDIDEAVAAALSGSTGTTVTPADVSAAVDAYLSTLDLVTQQDLTDALANVSSGVTELPTDQEIDDAVELGWTTNLNNSVITITYN